MIRSLFFPMGAKAGSIVLDFRGSMGISSCVEKQQDEEESYGETTRVSLIDPAFQFREVTYHRPAAEETIKPKLTGLIVDFASA